MLDSSINKIEGLNIVACLLPNLNFFTIFIIYSIKKKRKREIMHSDALKTNDHIKHFWIRIKRQLFKEEKIKIKERNRVH